MARSSDASHCITLTISVRWAAATTFLDCDLLRAALGLTVSRSPAKADSLKPGRQSPIPPDAESKLVNSAPLGGWEYYNHRVATRLTGTAVKEAVARVFVRASGELTSHIDQESEDGRLHSSRDTNLADPMLVKKSEVEHNYPIWTTEFWAGNPAVGDSHDRGEQVNEAPA